MALASAGAELVIILGRDKAGLEATKAAVEAAGLNAHLNVPLLDAHMLRLDEDGNDEDVAARRVRRQALLADSLQYIVDDE